MENPILWLILSLLNLYTYIVIAAVIASWLIAFNVINTHNQIVRSIVRTLDALTEPVFRVIRNVLPSFGGLDLSPIIVLFGIIFIEKLIVWAAFRFGFY